MNFFVTTKQCLHRVEPFSVSHTPSHHCRRFWEGTQLPSATQRDIPHIVGCAELSVGLSRPPRLTPFPLPWENIHAAASLPCVLVSFFILCLCGTLALREVQMCPVVLKEWLFTALCLPCASSSPPIPC